MIRSATVQSGILPTPDGQKIQYHHYKNGFDKVVVIAHGFFNSKDAVLLKELGAALGEDYDVIIFDFRGHGQSSGLFGWTAKEPQDLDAVLRYAKKDYRKVGVIGFSLGAAISLITAAKTDAIDSLISVSAPVDFWKIEFHFWQLDPRRDVVYNVTGQGRIGKGIRPGSLWDPKTRPIDIVSGIKAPVFYIHGQDDWLIRPWHSEELYKNTRSQSCVAMVRNGPHAEYLLLTHKEHTVALIKEWFQETLI